MSRLWTRGSVHGDNVSVRGVSTDTRAPMAGALVRRAERRKLRRARFRRRRQTGRRSGGAGDASARRRHSASDRRRYAIALGDLASAVRAQRRARVIGITGSNGKTTVKTLLASILQLHGKTHVNAGNFNNEIGLPLSLLESARRRRIRGARNGRGQTRRHRLSRRHRAAGNRTRQQHRAGASGAHGFARRHRRDKRRVVYIAARARRRGDQRRRCVRDIFRQSRRHASHRCVSASTQKADVRAENIRLGSASAFTLVVAPTNRIDIALPLAGRHNVQNALAAAACRARARRAARDDQARPRNRAVGERSPAALRDAAAAGR